MSLKMGKIKLTGSLQMGGSGGAKLPIHYDNDNELVNRPHINSHELIGDKTGEELGLQGTIHDITEQDIDNLIYGG